MIILEVFVIALAHYVRTSQDRDFTDGEIAPANHACAIFQMGLGEPLKLYDSGDNSANSARIMKTLVEKIS